MIVLAASVLTGGAPGGHDSLIKDALNGAESGVEIKALLFRSPVCWCRVGTIKTHRRGG